MTPPETKHTPTPWRVNRDNDQIGDIWAGDMPVAQIQPMGTLKHPDNELRHGNADFVVHCVNTHDALVKALEAYVEKDFAKSGTTSSAVEHNARFEAGKAALAAAKQNR